MVSAVHSFYREKWNFNAFRMPAEQIPIPDRTLDKLVNAADGTLALWPWVRPATRQGGALLTTQRSFSKLLDFSKRILAVKPNEWQARRDLARAHRELLDPETALSILAEKPLPDDRDGAVALTIEKARVELALSNPKAAIATLRATLTKHPTSLPLIEVLVDAELAGPTPVNALVAAKLHSSLTGGSEKSSALLRKAGGDTGPGSESRPPR